MGQIKGFLKYKRQEVGHRAVEQRIRDFAQLDLPLTPDEIHQQTARCMDCGIPFCHGAGCPLNNCIPDLNDLIYKGRWRDLWAGKIGAKDPAFMRLKVDTGLLMTLLMRMHVGARGGEYILGHFKEMIDAGIITDAMFPKVEACITALDAGVKKAHIIDGRIAHSLLLEIYTDKGIGTQIIKSV